MNTKGSLHRWTLIKTLGRALAFSLSLSLSLMLRLKLKILNMLSKYVTLQ